MCGIAGICSKNFPDEQVLDSMVDSLHHRGPDGKGKYITENCALGHARLSIIDLNTGDQPMHSADRQNSIVFNGEIYGYKELRDQLKDYSYKTQSDTEVILALYEKYGVDSLKHLPGMFAFAIWDEKEKRLFCARDRLGEKPFFYTLGKNGEFVFASEIKAILKSGLVKPEIDTVALGQYLQRSYIHPDRTIYKNIFVLKPAHYLLYEKGEVKVDRYWSFPDLNDKLSIDDAIENFKGMFERSVQRQLIADVPIGTFLSGGLDSSTIVAVASKFTSKLRTFSVGFGDAINELPYARQIAKKYSTDHTELNMVDQDIADLVLQMQDVYDEPFADTSNIPTYLICKEARKYMKVVLAGDGADELLAGYSWYSRLFEIEKIRDKGRRAYEFYLFLEKLYWKLGLRNRSPFHGQYRKLQNYIDEYKKIGSLANGCYLQRNYFSNEQVTELTNFEPNLGYNYAFSETGSFNDALMLDLEDYLPGDLLLKSDRASMANSH